MFCKMFLVKPQFEVGREKGGIVRNAADAAGAAEDIARFVAGTPHWSVERPLPSPISGGDGNSEFLLAARRD